MQKIFVRVYIMLFVHEAKFRVLKFEFCQIKLRWTNGST